MNNFVINFNSIAESWSQFVWTSTWQSVLVGVALIAIVALAKKIPAPIRYAILLVALIKFATPPFISAPSGIFSRVEIAQNESLFELDQSVLTQALPATQSESFRLAAVEPTDSIRSGKTPLTETEHQTETPTKVGSEYESPASAAESTALMLASETQSAEALLLLASEKLSVNAWFMLLHLVGFFCLCGWLLRSLWQLNSLKRSAYESDSKPLQQQFDSVCHQLGIKRKPKLLISDQLLSPISFGCWQPVVMLPKALLTNQDFTSIAIAHELAHLKRYDAYFNWLQNLLLTVWWFNPVLWLLNWQIRKLREDCCDDLVLADKIVSNEEYSRSLIEIAKLSNRLKSQVAIQTAFSMAEHPLKDRILRIMNSETIRLRRITWTGGLAILILCALCLPGIKMVMAGSDLNDDANGVASVTDVQTEQESTSNKDAAGVDELNPVSQRRSFVRFKIVDEAGDPVMGANVFGNVSGTRPGADRPEVINDNYETDEQGVAHIKVFDGAEMVRTWTSRDGFVTLFASWEDLTQEDVPELFTMQLQKATTIGGVVDDSDGKPVENVKVKVERESGGDKLDSNERTRLGSWLSEGKDAVRTDSAGRWEINNVPTGDVKLKFQLVHPEFLADERWQTMAHYGTSLEQLRDKTARMSIKRGLVVTGKVTDPDGNPVSDALIVWGDQPYWTDGSQETRTAEDGSFRTQALSPTETRLTVVAKGWMPDTRMIKPITELGSQDFELRKGKKIHLKFIDEDGKPLARTHVSLGEWRGSNALYNTRHPNVLESKIPNSANDNGEYIWNWAPEDGVEFSMSNRKLKVTHKKSIEPSEEIQTIVFKRPFRLFGKVVNEATSKPVDEFTITPITYRSKRAAERGLAQSSQMKSFKSSEFNFDDAFRLAGPQQIAFRFDAVGYKTFTTERFSYDSPSESVEIQLIPTATSELRIVDQAGKPVSGVRSWMVVPNDAFMVNSFGEYFADFGDPARKSDAEGLVKFSTPETRHAFVVAHKTGYAEQYLQPGQQPAEMKLQEWATLEGQLFQDGEPVRDATIMARPIRNLGGDNPHVQDIFQMRTDTEGRFRFEKLPPVPISVSSVLSAWRDFPITSNKSVAIDLKPGQSHKVNLGGEGLKVTGHVKLIGDNTNALEYRYCLNNLVSTKKPTIELPAHVNNDNELRFQAGEQAEYDRKLWGDGKRHGKTSYFVKLNSDGSFLINGVAPGSYRFLIKFFEPPEGCLVDPVGYKFLEFDTNDFEANGNAIDIGELEVNIKPIPKVGETLSNFRYKDLSGKPHYIFEHRGKYLLIDFWATWCQPCIASLPDVKALHEKIADHDDAELLSISLDKTTDPVAELIAAKKLKWSQGIIGDVKSTAAGKALGISSVPLYIVLDPEGSILSRSYSFDEASKVFQDAIKLK